MTASPRWLVVIAYCAIAFGSAVRFIGGDVKNYSHDEMLTSLRTTGTFEAQYAREVRGRVVTAGTLQRYQRGRPQAPLAIARALAVDDPQHPPLYYELEAFTSAAFGDSIAARRVLGAAFGVLTIICLYWLGRELAPAARTWPLLVAAFAAVSPLQMLYAQQAREYTLWGLATALASVLLLRAVRTNRHWLVYGASVVGGLYAYPFFAFTLVAHGAYLVITRAGARALRRYGIAVAVGALAFLPWVVNLVRRSDTVARTNTWFAAGLSPAAYAFKALFNASAVFFDAEYAYVVLLVLTIPVVALEVAGLVAVARSRDRRLATYVFALLFVSIAPLAIPDLLFHQSRASAARYLFPAGFAVEIATAYWLARVLESRNRAARAGATATILALLVLGCGSWVAQTHAEAWWPASEEGFVPAVGRAIAMRSPSVVVTADSSAALLLSNYVAPDQRFDIVTAPAFDRSLGPASAMLFFDPTEAERQRLARDVGRLELVYRPPFAESPFVHRLRDLPYVGRRLAPGSRTSDAGIAFELWAVAR